MLTKLAMLIAAAIAAVLAGCAASSGPAAVLQPVDDVAAVYVVRHFEKGPGDDPSLTPQGAARAKALARMLVSSGITAIFATPTRRAIESAAPLAQRLGINVTPYDPRDPEALARAVAAANGAVLVVGHSNTVPELVERFGGARPAPLTEADYGTLFEVTPGSTQVETRAVPAS